MPNGGETPARTHWQRLEFWKTAERRSLAAVFGGTEKDALFGFNAFLPRCKAGKATRGRKWKKKGVPATVFSRFKNGNEGQTTGHAQLQHLDF